MIKRGWWMLIAVLAITSSCNDDDEARVSREQDQFIWQAMNLYYFWQNEVEDLRDDRFSSFNELFSFTNGFNSSEQLFNSLLFEQDRFSFITDDFVALDNSFQGISTSFGYEFGLVRIEEGSDDIFGYVEYVLPNSPAFDAGIQRGDLFTEVNGSQLTVNNFQSLLFGQENYTLGFAEINENTITSNGQTVSMTAITLTENPILVSEILDVNGIQTGYLTYNQFVNNNDAHRELNGVFGSFISNGVTELVLDLRYNPGGSVTTARLLTSMIYGNAVATDVIGSIVYNSKLAELNQNLSFFDFLPILDEGNNIIGEESLNRLNINRVFILTSTGTASASELIIAGLLPYMEVVLIGDQTIGKNEGSVTLYDSPDDGFLSNEPGEVNPNHFYAIQPIISQLINSDGLNYNQGFGADVLLREIDFLGNFRPLGDPSEPLLEAALNIISGSAARFDQFEEYPIRNLLFESRSSKNHLQTIILDDNISEGINELNTPFQILLD